MNQAEVTKLVSKLRIKVNPEPRRLRNAQGPEGRLNKLRKTVTGLFKYERIELTHNRADEARQYAERLISEAIRHGDCHKPTMEIADFWLLEKELVHKLFKVLVPRYENSNTAFTRMYKAPRPEYSRNYEMAILELKGNPYPALVNKQTHNRLLIQNVLLDAAKYDYRQAKYAEMANKIGKAEESHKQSEKNSSIKANVLEEKSTES
ncbi:39S ribosomal protein L17, mitochondrial isoform X2 [Hyposmocoma kahamanoa]|uniref:39S ribosomal protein L17, mitochondrial isoform X2 n=1 Tax=Hyposmocoma kahamanoa TaxID=1477025 RepID=UPI000E6D689D|nr:39S ribosomal protein L17, mitochondrial isoform X2 [Hyposmocoma kahamanoa]